MHGLGAGNFCTVSAGMTLILTTQHSMYLVFMSSGFDSTVGPNGCTVLI